MISEPRSGIRIPTAADSATHPLSKGGAKKILLLLMLVAAIALSAGAQTSQEDRKAMRTGPTRSTHHETHRHRHSYAVAPVPGGKTGGQNLNAELAQIEKQASRPRGQQNTGSKVRGKVAAPAFKESARTANKNSQMNFQYRPPKSGSPSKGSRRGRQGSGGKGTGVKLR